MTSKEALENLYNFVLDEISGCESENEFYHKYNIVKKDLRALEILKKRFNFELKYYECPVNEYCMYIWNKEQELDYENYAWNDDLTKEEYNLLKEVLDNEK